MVLFYNGKTTRLKQSVDGEADNDASSKYNPALSLIDGGCAVLEMQPNESISRYAYVDSRSRRCSLFRITARWCGAN